MPPGPGDPVALDDDGVRLADGRFLPWLLLREAEVGGEEIDLLFRAPDGRLRRVGWTADEVEGYAEGAARVRRAASAAIRAGAAADPESPAAVLRAAAPRIGLLAAAAGATAAAVAATAVLVLGERLPPDVRWFLDRHGPVPFALAGLCAAAAAAEGGRRLVGGQALRRAAPRIAAEDLARRMEAAGTVEVRHRVGPVAWAWRCREGTWTCTTTEEGREGWTAGATPAEARDGLARLLAAGARLEPRPVDAVTGRG